MALILGWAIIRVRALISRRVLEGGPNTGTGPNSGTGSNSDNYGNSFAYNGKALQCLYDFALWGSDFLGVTCSVDVDC